MIGQAPPPDVAVLVWGFAELIAAGQPEAASTAMLDWVNDSPDDGVRARYFAATAVTLVAAKVRALGPPPGGYWQVRRSGLHDTAMCQIVARIANGEPDFADDLLDAHRLAHGAGGLFWVGVFAVRLLADLLTNDVSKEGHP